MYQIGERLKKARQQAMYTQAEVEQETGILQTTLSRYENNALEPNINNLRILIDLYNVNASWLLDTGMKNNKKDSGIDL